MKTESRYNDLFGQIEESLEVIRSRSKLKPEVGLILGTGLGKLTKKIKEEASLAYKDIPNMPHSTVKGHGGKLVLGNVDEKNVVAMEGRLHFYEGYSLEEITYPIRLMKHLGVKTLIITNAAGGMNPDYEKGDIAVITDHINLMGSNPLIGVNDERLGPRFPDMCEPYSKELIALVEKVVDGKKINLKKGVYIGVTGPCLETRAEYKFMRMIGGDLVGMSTVPEVIVSVQAGIKVLGLSVVTDMCLPDELEPVNIEEIIKTATEAGPKLDTLVESVIRKL